MLQTKPEAFGDKVKRKASLTVLLEQLAQPRKLKLFTSLNTKTRIGNKSNVLVNQRKSGVIPVRISH